MSRDIFYRPLGLYGCNLQAGCGFLPFAVPGECPQLFAFVPRRPLHTLPLPLSPPPAAGKLVAMVGMTGDPAVAVEESLKK